jgi:PTS system galactitol-specific IIA component
MPNVEFSPSLVVIFNDKSSYQEVEAALAHKLVELGYAKESFPDAIAKREIDYPTGLDVEGINAAMPHCDVSNVNKPAVCVGVLRKPVPWRRMDEPDVTCEVSFVSMLALTEAHAHLAMLQKVVALIQDQALMKKIVDASDADEVYELACEKLF